MISMFGVKGENEYLPSLKKFAFFLFTARAHAVQVAELGIKILHGAVNSQVA